MSLNNHSPNITMAPKIDLTPNILFTNIEAFSGNTIGLETIEKKEHFRIPGLKGALVAFNINGNSMSPTIKSGDMVICSPLDNLKELKENEIYAVVTHQSVWVKRVQRCFNRYGKWTHLKLISDNFTEFDPFTIDLGAVKKLLKVKVKLTGLE